MAKIYDRVHLLMLKQNRLKREHGVIEGGDMFLRQHGQDAVDEIFDYILKCSTVENHLAAEAKGYPPGTCIIPMYREA